MSNRVHESVNVIEAGTTEPLDLYDVKEHLNEDSDEHDGYILGLISVARDTCERHLGRSLLQTTYNLTMDGFPPCDSPIEIPNPPLVSVTSVKYVDDSGAQQTIDPSNYLVDTASRPGRIHHQPMTMWPVVQSDRMNTVEVVFVAGNTLSPTLRQYMLLMIGAWYRNRESISDKTLTIPPHVEALLSLNDWGRYP